MSETSTPAKVALNEGLGLRAWLVEREQNARLIADDKAGSDKAGWLEDMAYFRAARDALDELEKTRRSAAMISGMFGRNVMAMQAALIDKVLRGHHEGWDWIINTLEGPGLLPDLEAARKMGGAQAWFDAELAEEEARIAGLKA